MQALPVVTQPMETSEPGALDQAGAERRQIGRRRVLKKALIVFKAGHCSMGCHVLDMSAAGAQLAPADIFLCPNEFTLKPLFDEPRSCQIAWRRGAKIGVRFL